jgi:hypothetical protein
MLKAAQLELAARLGLIKTTVDVDAASKDPRISGGLVPVTCPKCGREIGPADSYHVSLSGERLHAECYQRP